MKFPVKRLPVFASVRTPGTQFELRNWTDTGIALLTNHWNALAEAERVLSTAGERHAVIFVRTRLERLAEVFAWLENRAILQSGFGETLEAFEVKGGA